MEKDFSLYVASNKLSGIDFESVADSYLKMDPNTIALMRLNHIDKKHPYYKAGIEDLKVSGENFRNHYR